MNYDSPGELRAKSLYRAFRQAGPTILQVIGAVILALYPLWTDDGSWLEDLPWIPGAVGGTITLGGAIWALAIKPTRNELLQKKRELEKHIQLHEGPTSERITFILRMLLIELGLDAPEHRVSLFARHANSSFTLVGRYSADAHLRTAGRAVYAAGQGLVDYTWGVPQSHRDNFPLTRAKWNKAIAREFQMDLAVVSELRMHSLSYVCRRVDRNVGAIPVPVGVLIIESTLQTGATAEMQDILQDFKFWPLLTTECQAHMDAAKHRDGWV